jgi:hypothetical protein
VGWADGAWAPLDAAAGAPAPPTARCVSGSVLGAVTAAAAAAASQLTPRGLRPRPNPWRHRARVRQRACRALPPRPRLRRCPRRPICRPIVAVASHCAPLYPLEQPISAPRPAAALPPSREGPPAEAPAPRERRRGGRRALGRRIGGLNRGCGVARLARAGPTDGSTVGPSPVAPVAPAGGAIRRLTVVPSPAPRPATLWINPLRTPRARNPSPQPPAPPSAAHRVHWHLTGPRRLPGARRQQSTRGAARGAGAPPT